MCKCWFVTLLCNTLYGVNMEDVNFSDMKICNFCVLGGFLKYK